MAEPVHHGRVDRLAERLAAHELDALVVTSKASVTFLTGTTPLVLERLFAVVVRRGGGNSMLAPSLDEAALREALPRRLSLTAYPPASDGLPELCELLRGSRVVGVESRALSYARARALLANGLELAPADDLVTAERARKDEGELTALRHACQVVEQAMTSTLEGLAVGCIEHEVGARAEAMMRRQGATECTALVLFGPHAARPHATSGGRALAAGDVACIDLAARIDGYWGDLTRCATAGPASVWARQAWGAVTEAHGRALDAVRPGVSASEVERAAREALTAAPQLGDVLHGAGHGLGLEVHEPPFLTPGAEACLEPGAVLAIEPALYREGSGGLRLEDMVLVADAGASTLSTLPRDLHEVPA